MPQVGQKHFPYTKSGMAAAKKASKKSGKKIRNRKAAEDAVMNREKELGVRL